MKPVTPALRRVAEAARKHADFDPALAAALAALDEADADAARRHEEALRGSGHDCAVCGQRFLPLPGDSHVFCSIGCKYADAP